MAHRLPLRVIPLATALALVLLAPGATAQSEDGFEGDLTVHATPDGPAGTEFETCRFYVRGHGAPGSSGTVTFLYASNGTFQPTQQELAFTGEANATGGFDFVAGPFEVPPGGPELTRVNMVLANITTEGGQAVWFLQGLDLTCPAAEVPFFTSSLALGLGVAGLLGAGFVLHRKR